MAFPGYQPLQVADRLAIGQFFLSESVQSLHKCWACPRPENFSFARIRSHDQQ